MTPQEKADELVRKYQSIKENNQSLKYDVQCAIIAVEEILDNSEGNESGQIPLMNTEICCDEDYWQEVLQQLKSKL